MKFGCCVADADAIAVIAAAGFDFAELPAAAVRPFDDDREATPALAALERAALPVEAFNVLIPASLPLVGPTADHAALRTYLRRAFGRMASLGGSVAVLGSGAARRIPEDMDRAAALEQLAAAVSIAGDESARAGVELALEPLNRNECNVLNTLEEAAGFVEHYELRDVRLLADLYHIALEEEPLDQVTAARPLLAHVHVAGGERRAPGTPGYPYAGFMATLRAAGYDRRISAECRWSDLEAEAGPALTYMRRAWDQTAPEARMEAS